MILEKIERLARKSICQTLFYLAFNQKWSRIGTVVSAFALHQCVPGSFFALGIISGLSLLVLYSAPRGFSLVFLSPQKQPFDLIQSLFDLQSPQLLEYPSLAKTI